MNSGVAGVPDLAGGTAQAHSYPRPKLLVPVLKPIAEPSKVQAVTQLLEVPAKQDGGGRGRVPPAIPRHREGSHRPVHSVARIL